MVTAALQRSAPRLDTLADLLERLGDIPLYRVRMHPAPGTATAEDVIQFHERFGRLCELIEGVLVEKDMAFYESRLAMTLGRMMDEHATNDDLGIVIGADGPVELAGGLVRIPDVSFFSWRHFPNRELPDDPIPSLAPDLAVEVLSKGNTPEEMRRKRIEFFRAGVKLVWEIDPAKRIATVYTSPTRGRILGEDDALDGGRVLPGFRITLRELLKRAGRRGRR